MDDYEDDPTTNYCANPDNDAGGEWCYVTEEGEICEGLNWGYCAAEGAGTPGVLGCLWHPYINCRSIVASPCIPTRVCLPMDV